MKNILLPADFDRSVLNGPKTEMLALAMARAEERGGEIELCGDCENWDDCFSGFVRRGGKVLVLLLNFNVGRDTLGIKMEVQL